MATLKDKTENALNEGRILLLGGQVLIGSAFRSVFLEGFQTLSREAQYARVAALSFMTLGLGILLLPAAYHQIVEPERNNTQLLEFTSRGLEIALLPFAFGLAVDAYTVIAKTNKEISGIIAGFVVFALAITFWYAIAFMKRKPHQQKQEEEALSLTEKIKEVLMETRMVLPGAQALLGFQVATVFTEGFEKLQTFAKWIHAGSMLAIGLSSIFLIAPAAYHRIAAHGEESEEFYRVAGRFLLTAMFFLGLGIAGDFVVVLEKIAVPAALAWAAGGTLLTFLYGLWFGYTTAKRARLPNET